MLDLADPTDRARLGALVLEYDVVVADGPEPAVGLAELRATNPDVVLVTVSGFGSTGPLAGMPATHLTTCALGGWALTCGLPDREPLQSGVWLTDTVCGSYAAVGALAAIIHRSRYGTGDHVDVSSWEAAITCALGPTFATEFRGEELSRHSHYNTGPSFNLRCADGYVGVNVLTEAQWQTLCAFIGRVDFIDDERFADYFGRLAHIDEIRTAIEEALAGRSAAEVFHEAQSWRLPFGLVPSPMEALDLAAHEQRGFFVAVDHPVVGPLRIPRPPYVMTATPATPTRPPLLGEHDAEVLDQPRDRRPDARRPLRYRGHHTAAPGVRAPLDDVRIVDFTAFQAGPMVTLFAADLGADVIKVEAIQRLDGWRGVGRGGSRPWEHSGLFNWANRGKRGITLNLDDPRAVAAITRVIEQADVVIENFTPRVMPNFGLDYESLRRVNPDLVMLSMPGFGGTGEWRDYAGFAWTTEQMSTICHQTGYADSGPLFSGTTNGDPLAALMGAVALFSALHHRNLTGQGQHIDLSQVEAVTTFVGEALIAAQLTGRDFERRGNRHHVYAPHGTYPAAGDDRWVAIACRDDDEWSRLWDAIGRPGGRATPPHPTAPERHLAADEIDAWIAAWTARHDALEAQDRLLAAGVPAGAVMNGADLLAAPHLAARGFWLAQDRDEIGIKHYLASPFRFTDTVLPPPRAAPYLGEFNREVLCGLAGLDEDDLAALERDHVIGDAPLVRG